jgi:hypothetical protein
MQNRQSVRYRRAEDYVVAAFPRNEVLLHPLNVAEIGAVMVAVAAEVLVLVELTVSKTIAPGWSCRANARAWSRWRRRRPQLGRQHNKAGVPRDIRFKTKPEIALEQIRWACEAGLPRGVALTDGAYGTDSRLCTGMTALGVSYVVGIQPKILVWPPGTGPRRRGRPLNNTGRRDEPDLISAKCLAHDLPKHAWHTIRWPRGFGRVVIVAPRPRARSGRT